MRMLVTSLCAALVVAGSGLAEGVPDLIQQLKDREAGTRRDAASALADLGPQAKPAVPALILALKDKDLYVRRRRRERQGQDLQKGGRRRAEKDPGQEVMIPPETQASSCPLPLRGEGLERLQFVSWARNGLRCRHTPFANHLGQMPRIANQR